MQLYFAKVLIISAITDFVHSQSDEKIISDGFTIIHSPGEEVNIICQNDFWMKFPNVKVNAASVPNIVFKNCTYPAIMNIPGILHSMEIKLSFPSEVTLTHFHSIPHRQNFQGLSTFRLNIWFYNFTEVPSDLLYDVMNLRSLGIRNTQLRRIPRNFFSKWAENVVEIEIVDNKLQKIARHDFSLLVNVKIISLTSNEIKVIESGAFDGLTTLIRLELGPSFLHTLPPGIFHQTTSLMRLVLNSNSFDELPQDLLVNTTDLENFSMMYNNGTVATLPRGLFKNLTRIKSVDIRFTQLENLPEDLFDGCSSLHHLTLSDNQLTRLPSGLFGDTRNLRYLDISKNRLQSLPSGIFKSLDNLVEVYIDSNQLTTLMPEVLEGLQSVRDFHASYNNLTRIDDQFMMYLKAATTIDLSHNQISFDSRNKMKLLKYQSKFSLNSSLIETSTTTLKSKSNVDTRVKLKTEVNLENNRITKFNADLINILKYSKQVNLDSNPITEVDLFQFPPGSNISNGGNSKFSVSMVNTSLHCDCNIVDLVHYLNGNPKNIPYDIEYADNRKFVLSLICASPAKFKGQFTGDLRPEELNCLRKGDAPDDACYETCDCWEYTEKRILSVDCSRRNLTRIPLLIGNTRKFSIQLNMTGNILQHSPSLKGSYLKNVTSLDLSYNNITKITTDLFSSKLQQLKLHGNSISRLDSDVISHLSGSNNTLSSITLHENKWICDCEARELLTFVQMKFESYRFGEMKCHGSHEKLYEMTATELCKDLIIIIVTFCLSITFLGIIVASLITLYYKYQREIKIWLYSKQLCLWFVTEDELDKDKEYDAFISFSQKDEHFVEEEIVANLEGGPRPYKLCLHYRDWLAGEWIPTQISRSVEASRRTIVILTPNFLESVWGLLEFRTAHTQAVKDGRARLIVIIHGDIGNIDHLDQEMQDYLRLNTYIKWGDKWFWKKLRYALPHSKDFFKRKTRKVAIAETHLALFTSANNSGANSCELNLK